MALKWLIFRTSLTPCCTSCHHWHMSSSPRCAQVPDPHGVFFPLGSIYRKFFNGSASKEAKDTKTDHCLMSVEMPNSLISDIRCLLRFEILRCLSQCSLTGVTFQTDPNDDPKTCMKLAKHKPYNSTWVNCGSQAVRSSNSWCFADCM